MAYGARMPLGDRMPECQKGVWCHFDPPFWPVTNLPTPIHISNVPFHI